MPTSENTATLTIDAAGWLRDAAGRAGSGAAALAEQLLGLLSSAGISTTISVSVPLPSIPSSPAGPAPADPVTVVAALTDAVNWAGTVLAPQNLVVMQGRLESAFNLDDGSGAAATARLSLTVAPKPYR